MPPLHTESPAERAAAIAAVFSRQLWVVQMLGKNFSELSRLLCMRSTPASLSAANCGAASRPSEAQTESPVSLFILAAQRQTDASSSSDSLPPEVTSEKRSAPPASAAWAAARLRAKFAVLRAASALRVHDCAEVKAAATAFFAYLGGGGAQRRKRNAAETRRLPC